MCCCSAASYHSELVQQRGLVGLWLSGRAVDKGRGWGAFGPRLQSPYESLTLFSSSIQASLFFSLFPSGPWSTYSTSQQEPPSPASGIGRRQKTAGERERGDSEPGDRPRPAARRDQGRTDRSTPRRGGGGAIEHHGAVSVSRREEEEKGPLASLPGLASRSGPAWAACSCLCLDAHQDYWVEDLFFSSSSGTALSSLSISLVWLYGI